MRPESKHDRFPFATASFGLATALDEWKNAGADALTVVEAMLRFIQSLDQLGEDEIEAVRELAIKAMQEWK